MEMSRMNLHHTLTCKASLRITKCHMAVLIFRVPISKVPIFKVLIFKVLIFKVLAIPCYKWPLNKCQFNIHSQMPGNIKTFLNRTKSTPLIYILIMPFL